ncbi:MAG TPA: UDP-N-acetylglucosamine 1-carboxyvinyltransferase, partial [Clostridiales bacterium]|nr:UDP-N-acetylglucosamine 1-carboxyvinyltransferase [Clostridiales bacterium]
GQGRTLFVETMFDSRYRHVEQLQRMGADITTAGQVALVRGVPRLHGGRVEATDLRGGGALAVAALGAEGESTLAGLHHVDRGYEQLEQVLQGLGAKVHRVEALPEEAHCAQ